MEKKLYKNAEEFAHYALVKAGLGDLGAMEYDRFKNEGKKVFSLAVKEGVIRSMNEEDAFLLNKMQEDHDVDVIEALRLVVPYREHLSMSVDKELKKKFNELVEKYKNEAKSKNRAKSGDN